MRIGILSLAVGRRLRLALFSFLYVVAASAFATAQDALPPKSTVQDVFVPPVSTVEPIATQPVETQPVETQPVETQPVETQPVETQPVETQPVETVEPVAEAPGATSSGRQTVSLDGVWDFATDPENVGESARWFAPDVALPTETSDGYAPEIAGKIRVPGVWDDQGYGTSTGKVRHNFIGVGWYKRSFEVPLDWTGKRIFLKIGGVSRYAKGWINGESFGPEILGYVGAREREITPWVKPGETAVVALRVDSKQRWDVDVTLGASALNDYMNIVWGGVWGRVELEARAASTVDSVLVRTDYRTGNCVLSVDVANSAGTAAATALRVDVFDAADGSNVATATAPLTDEESAAEKLTKTIDVSIPNVKLWTPETPNLYRFETTLLQGDAALDSVATRIGVRGFEADGPNLLLNGKPIFLRGYGDDHIYPIEFSMSTDKNMYLERLAIIKKYGFNHVRHHSVVMPQEYYDACDEIGMTTTCEYVLGYPQQLPESGDLWKQNVAPGTDPEIARAFLCESFETVVRQFRDHPSIVWWVGGNELVMAGWDVWREMNLRYRFQKIAKTNDPDRLFIDCDGDWLNLLKTGEKERDTMDLFSVLFDEWSSPIKLGAKKFEMEPFSKPSLSHESGNYCPFMRIDQYELFDAFPLKDGTVKQSNFIPFWMTDGLKKLDELGLTDEAPAWSDASEKLYFQHHKYNVEGMRLNPAVVGYYWWLIQDYWTTSNGLVDYFFRPKPGIDPAAVRNINAETVVLQQDFPRSARSGDEISVRTFVSNFSGDALNGKAVATLSLDVAETTQPLLSVALATTNCPVATTTETGIAKFVVPNLKAPAKGTLRVEFQAENGATFYNTWTCRVFPRETALAARGPIYSNLDADLFPRSWNILPLPEKEIYPNDAIYVVDDLSEPVAQALVDGAKVVYLGVLDALPTTKIQYQQTWWKSGDSVDSNNCGTFAYEENPIVRGLTDGGFCDVEWFDLIDGAQKMNVESAPAKPEIVLRALSSIVRVEDTALIFTTKVDAGTLVVSGLNHFAAKGRPENETIVARLIEAAATAKPESVWPAKFLISEAKLPEGTVLGYARALGFPETNVWKSFRRDGARSIVCRQTSKNNVFSWTTGTVAPGAANVETSDDVVFIFAGGFGYSGEPKTDGFTFALNGDVLFQFDLPTNGESTEWSGPNGEKLSFEVRRTEPQDVFGVFRLTVPRAKLIAGKRQTITVKSLGEGSRRWFAVNPETNLVD